MDSYFEYLLKAHLLLGDPEFLTMFFQVTCRAKSESESESERESAIERERKRGREGDSHTPVSLSTSLPCAGIAALMSSEHGTCKTFRARL